MSSSNLLKERIHTDYLDTGKWSVGAKLPTIKELANQYGVSAPTIGKAVELLAAEGWLAKRRGSGLYIARSASEPPVSDRQEQRIGYVSINPSGTLVHQALTGVARVVNNHNGVLELGKTDWLIENERRQIERMIARGVQGVVLYPTPFRTANDEYLGREFRDFPIVVIDLYESAMKRPHVIFDNFSAGRDMTWYLVGQNRRRIAFIKFDDIIQNRAVNDRAAGYRQALKEAGIPFVPERLVSYNQETDYSACLEVLEKLITLDPRPDAIIVPWDGVVPVVINHLRSKGISVPDEIIVAGFDNLPLNNLLEHWPTTNPDFDRMGERAAEILFDRMASHNQESSEVVLPCPLHFEETPFRRALRTRSYHQTFGAASF
jgi:GntR family transcriptional regulator of arabinose operon